MGHCAMLYTIKMFKYEGGHCVFSELQSKFKRCIFYMPKIAGISLIYGLISEMNLMCPETC